MDKDILRIIEDLTKRECALEAIHKLKYFEVPFKKEDNMTQCWGCGLTRGMMHLIHLDFVGAYNYNKLSFLILPLLIFDLLQIIL